MSLKKLLGILPELGISIVDDKDEPIAPLKAMVITDGPYHEFVLDERLWQNVALMKYTISHELGHIICKHPGHTLGSIRAQKYEFVKDEWELEADLIAASIQFPESISNVIRSAANHRILGNYALARIFNAEMKLARLQNKVDSNIYQAKAKYFISNLGNDFDLMTEKMCTRCESFNFMYFQREDCKKHCILCAQCPIASRRMRKRE